MNREQVMPGVGAPGLVRTGAALPAMAAILFGGFLLWGVGFAHSDMIHEAAHDSRHSFAFPCH